jgi:membrane associated rhomboid family serine protease
MMNMSRARVSRLADLLVLFMVPLLAVTADLWQAQPYFERHAIVAVAVLVAAFFTALMAVFNTGFSVLSTWCALGAGLIGLSNLNIAMRGLEAPVAALYLTLQIFIPRVNPAASDEADSAPPTVTVSSNFSNVHHREPAVPLAKEDLWKRTLYTAERVRRNWTLHLAHQPFPPLTLALIALVVTVFVIGWYGAPTELRRITALWHGLYPLAASDALVLPGLMRVLSAAALTWSVSQLVLNSILLLWLGRVLEPTLGPLRFAASVLIGAVAGVAAAALRPDALQVGAGIAGAVYALMGIALAINLIHFRVLDLEGKRRFFALPAVFALIAYNALASNLSLFSPFSHAATLGGLLAGIALVLITGPYYDPVADPANPNRLLPRIRSGLAVLRRV